MEPKKLQRANRIVIPDDVDEIEVSMDIPRHIKVIYNRKGREPKTRLMNITPNGVCLV
jgi:hypothetical protein